MLPLLSQSFCPASLVSLAVAPLVNLLPAYQPTHCLEMIALSTLTGLFATFRALSQNMPCSTLFAIFYLFGPHCHVLVHYVSQSQIPWPLFMLYHTIFCALSAATLCAHFSTLTHNILIVL